ncbi:MAG TPA: 1-acyl-sn-glycerol-3-phosphate acyltransferase, partial [Polyangiaceae bacterium]
RAISVPGYALALAIWITTAPLVVPLLFVVDLARGGRSSLLRFWITFGAFFGCEMLGLVAAAFLAVTGNGSDLDRNYRLQWWWARMLLAVTRTVFAMKVEVEGIEAARGGPIVLALRHASVGDTLLPAALVSSATAIRLRYVLKRELLWDPCLDIVGRRLPNAFVRRGSSDPARERLLVAGLAAGLGPNDGVLIFPEGTRFSPRRRADALAKLAISHHELAVRAQAFENVLPPRLGGMLALLEAAPAADVVFGAHTGFDGVRTLGDLVNGALVGRTIRLRLHRVPAAEIPADHDARVAWLFDQWKKVDDFVAAGKDAS